MALNTTSYKRQGATISDTIHKKQKSDHDDFSNVAENIVDQKLELTDPTPNIEHLFESLDAKYFAGLLSKNNVKLEWSTSIDFRQWAGLCSNATKEEPITIQLSEPLLKYRTRQDLVVVLLHEMIHAYLFSQGTSDAHGPNFQRVMDRINAETGANITVFHEYTDEIALYEKRLWRCNGKCKRFVLIQENVKAVADLLEFKLQSWWRLHAKKCRGKFELVYG